MSWSSHKTVESIRGICLQASQCRVKWNLTFFAKKWRPVSWKMVPNVRSNLFVKAVSISIVSFILSHFHKCSSNLQQKIYFLVCHMPTKLTRDGHVLGLKSCCILVIWWIWTYNFCFTKFRLFLIGLTLFWTSSQLSVPFWDCTILDWKYWFSGVSQIRRDEGILTSGCELNGSNHRMSMLTKTCRLNCFDQDLN